MDNKGGSKSSSSEEKTPAPPTFGCGCSDGIVNMDMKCVYESNSMSGYMNDTDVRIAEEEDMEPENRHKDPRDISLAGNAAVQLNVDSLINLMLNTIHDGGFADAIFNMPAIKIAKIPFYNRFTWNFDVIEMSERDSF
uniref:uncharacterized protein LOC122607878 n=1 Tax=Erigeron canadensis TaxID=72917 RepID=UPI001CB93586|nr:uncharacterized protein LOC122607878 [Erigeron canadensis]